MDHLKNIIYCNMKKHLSSKRRSKFIPVIALLLVTLNLSYNPVLAVSGDSGDPNYEYALKLKELGVFLGSDVGYELDRTPTRLEGLIMLIRLLGKETEAQKLSTEPSVFSDVPKWAIGYTNYAKQQQLTQGLSPTLFGTSDTLTLQQYTTFLLRALQYSDSKGDFTFDSAISKGISVGMLPGDSSKTTLFTRSNLAKISYTTLTLNIKQSNTSLAKYLVNVGSMDETTAIALQLIPNPAVIDGKTYVLKDPMFYDLGETNASIDVLSSATIQGASKNDVLDHYTTKTSETKSLITIPTKGYSNLIFRYITSRTTSNNKVTIYSGDWSMFSALSGKTPYKTLQASTTSVFISIDLSQMNNPETVTLELKTDGPGHLYLYNLYLN